MAPQIDAMLVSPDTMTKGGGQHVFSFLICAFSSDFLNLALMFDNFICRRVFFWLPHNDLGF